MPPLDVWCRRPGQIDKSCRREQRNIAVVTGTQGKCVLALAMSSADFRAVGQAEPHPPRCHKDITWPSQIWYDE